MIFPSPQGLSVVRPREKIAHKLLEIALPARPDGDDSVNSIRLTIAVISGLGGILARLEISVGSLEVGLP